MPQSGRDAAEVSRPGTFTRWSTEDNKRGSKRSKRDGAHRSTQRGTQRFSWADYKANPLKVLETHDGRPARFGSIRFPGRSSRARWVRCSSESGADDLLELLTHSWDLPSPGAIISVMGPAQLDQMLLPQSAREVLSRGLQRASTRAKAWIITGGGKAGAAGLVGEVRFDPHGSAPSYHHHPCPQP